MKPVVAIVGRPNVGKSALFNRLLGRRLAIVEDVPGVTRDRLCADVDWCGKWFTLVDTGGLPIDIDDEIAAQVRRQVELGVAEADVVVFVIDAQTGVVPHDREVADLVRRSGKPVVLVANKAEGPRLEAIDAEAYRLGFGDPVAVSAAHGIGTGDLLDRIVSALPETRVDETEDETVKVAIVGRPNVGKSSILNGLLGEERVIVTPVPGTTRDAVDVPLEKGDRKFVFIDTAGMRRPSRVEEPVERYSIARTLKAVDRCDVAILVVAADDGIADQDKKIAGYVSRAGKALVINFNRWDLVARGEGGAKKDLTREYIEIARWQLGFVAYAPVNFSSATLGRGLERLLDCVWRVAQQHRKRVGTSDLNRVIGEAIQLSPPPSEKGRQLKIYYAAQTGSKPPAFTLFVNSPDLAKEPYVRYLEGRLREAFGFEGTPLRLKFRRRD